MIYLTAIFVPPLYFLIKKNWLGFILTSFAFLFSLMLMMTIVLAWGALVCWWVCAICAVWNLRKQVMRENAKMIAEEMAAKMANLMRPPQSASLPPKP